MKIVQNVLFRQCGGHSDQIAFLNVSEPKIALPDWNSHQYVKTVGFLWTLYKTCFLGHAEDVLPKSHFSTFQIQELLRGPKLTPISENSRLSMKIVQNVLFRQCGGRFGQIAFFNVLDKKNRSTGLKFTQIRENSRLSMKIEQNVLFRQCGWRFDDSFWVWNVEKCDLAKTSSALPGKHVLYNFHTKPTVFKYWREFQSGGVIFWSKTLKNAISSKRPQHCLKSTFCTILIQRLLFSRIGVNFGPLSNFWIWNVEKWDLAKTSSAWPEKHVL